MAIVRAVWGIDIGRCALTAVKLRPGADNAVELVAAEYIEHSKILSQPDADRHELIGEALEKFLSRNDISKDDVVISVPGQQTLARFTKLPPVAPKKIPDIVRYEADQQIPFDMDEVIWDYQTFQQEDAPDLEVGIFAMKRELIREHLLHFEQASIEPVAVQPTPLAVYNAVVYDGGLGDETTIVLDIGADNTDLIIATSDSFWTRTIQKGGNSCTDALVKSFKLSFSKAEHLKRSAETSKYRRQIFQAMRPVFADLVQELQRSIGFYSSTHRDASITRVFAVGNAFKLPGLKKYLQQNLGLDVVCPEKFSGVSSGLPGGSASEHSLSLWGAYGLALQGLDRGKVTSNLLPTEIAKQIVWRKKKPAFAAAAACLVLAGGSIWFRQSADLNALAASGGQADAVQVSKANAARLIENGPSSGLAPREKAVTILQAGESLKKELASLAGKGEEERARTEELIRVQSNKAMVPRILSVIHDSVPRAPGPLGEAEDPVAYTEAVASLGLERGRREQLFIETIDIQYAQDVNEAIWPDALISAAEPINDPEAETPGFKIRLLCTTPHHEGRNFVGDTLLANLIKNGRRAGQGFYIDRANIVYGGRYDPEEPVPGGIPDWYSSGEMIRGRTGSAKRPAGVAKDYFKQDPLTNEPLGQDWRFEIWIDVICEDFMEPERDGGQDGGGREDG
ncbi:MAG: type IV pilus assembly protein PilM [Phycisphaerae bacterium]